MKKIVWLVIPWIIILNLFMLASWNRWNVSRDTAYDWIDPHHLHTPAWSLIGLPARWDSEWYLDVARNGYIYKGPEALSNIVFLPSYPFLIRIVGWLLAGQLVLAGWLVSLASLFGACYVFFRLTKEYHKKIDPEEAIFFLLVFPTAVFFNAVYTESLFLLISLATIYLARRNKFVAASALGFFAALTRITGVLLFIPLIMEFWSAYGWKKFLQPKLAALLLVPAGLATFFAYHWYAYGNPLLFFKIEANWGRNFTLNTEHFQTVTSAAQANLALDVTFLLVALAATIYVFFKIRKSYALYMLATIAVAVSTGTLMSIGRYVLVLFPMYLAAADQKPQIKRIWTIISILLLGLYATLYAHSYWAG